MHGLSSLKTEYGRSTLLDAGLIAYIKEDDRMIKMVVNPNALTFREDMQGRIDEIATRFINGN